MNTNINPENKVKLTKEVLFEAIGSIGDDILERSEQKPRKKEPTAKRIFALAAMAAAFFLIFGTLVISGLLNGPNGNSFLFPQEALSGGCYPEYTSTSRSESSKTSDDVSGGCSPPTVSKPEISHIYEWQPFYNRTEEPPQSDRAYVPGYFTEKLTEEQLDILKPEETYDQMLLSGTAGYSGEGDLVDITLRVAYKYYSGEIFINISENDISKCYLVEDEEIKSFCNGVYYTLYNYSSGHYEIYEADAEINGLYYHFSIKTLYKFRSDAENILKLTLESFATYDEAPDLSLITPKSIPYFEDTRLSYSEAKEDETFGAYLPESMPDGFTEESVRRYIDSDENYLSALWCKDLDSISYVITDEAHYDKNYEKRLISVNDTEKYDLSLYPIPRAESVPDELYEIVDNPIFRVDDLTLDAVLKRTYYVEDAGDTDGPRMNFTVMFENTNDGVIFIEINAKGIEPDWLFETLKSLQ